MAGAALLALLVMAAPAGASQAHGNATPKVVKLDAAKHGRTVDISVVARDRDDIVRGLEVDWGEAAQGSSSCTIVKGRDADAHRRGKKRRLRASYTYAAAGDHAITVRAISGGCTEGRPEQRSAARTIHVRVD
jgi:hypothetical protein